MTRPESTLGHAPPSLRTALPGPAGAALVEVLASAECPALTSRRARRSERSGAPQDPIVWREARGSNVVDVDGNVYVDLTSGFGVMALGHGHPRVVEAVREQAGRLLHALGDVHPSDVKVELLERLASLGPWKDARVILGSHGADAVEAALKTAALTTKRAGVLAFEGGYHGLSHGPLAICGYQPAFRAPFEEQLNRHVTFAPYPEADATVEQALADVRAAYEAGLPRSGPIGAIVVEPMLGRGGVRVPPRGFLAALGALAREIGALLIVDEVFTGLHRTGPRFFSVFPSVRESSEDSAPSRSPVARSSSTPRSTPAPGVASQPRRKAPHASGEPVSEDSAPSRSPVARSSSSEPEGFAPDLLCIGKALGGGMPISACIGRAEAFAGWGDPGGEAIHTATFFGHPLACAAALAMLDALEETRIEGRTVEEHVVREGAWLTAALREAIAASPSAARVVSEVRGEGLALGVVLDRGDRMLRVMRRLLERGYLVVPAGADARVVQIAPPLDIARPLLEGFVATLVELVAEDAEAHR